MKSPGLELNWLQNMQTNLNRLKSVFISIAKKVNLHGMLRTNFYDKWYMQAIKIEHLISSKGWTYLGSGKDRRVWRRGNVVIKIAYNESGVLSNYSERYLYRNFKNSDVQYAPCRMVQENILMMRYVKELDDLDPCQYNMIPEWALSLHDGPQVGMDKNGRIMAYDYAEEDRTMIRGGNHRAPSDNRG